MLVITRKIGTSVNIGKDIKIHFLSRNGEQFRIGIDAPKDILILRSELQNKKREKNENTI